MFRKIKKSSSLDVKVLESTKDHKLLIRRIYKPTSLEEYVICSDYDFNSNTHNGKTVFNVVQAYSLYNIFVNTGVIPVPKQELVV